MFLINRLLAVSSLLVYGAAAIGAEPSTLVPNYVGSKTCAGCHATAAQAWRLTYDIMILDLGDWRNRNGKTIDRWGCRPAGRR